MEIKSKIRIRDINITNGIYLVIDPSMEEAILFEKLDQVLDQGIAVVQIWDNWAGINHKERLVKEICHLCHRYEVPVLINNEWQLLNSLPLDGVHFDSVPINYDQIKLHLTKDFLVGITCNNDLSVIKWAESNDLDYISFCSMFPSATSNSCELVSLQTVEQARKITTKPVFLAGGIRLSNLAQLKGLDYNGIALISGIMNSKNPAETTKQYKKLLTNINRS